MVQYAYKSGATPSYFSFYCDQAQPVNTCSTAIYLFKIVFPLMARQTRSAGCPILGAPSELPLSQLPTNADVLKSYQYVRYHLKVSALEPTISEISNQIADNVRAVWTRASIPVISNESIVKKVKKLHETYRDKIKRVELYDSRNQTKEMLDLMNSFRNECESTLFDVAACKCASFNECTCPKDRRVPIDEQDFLIDQRSGHRMYHIDRVDQKATRKIRRREIRLQKEEERQRRYQESLQEASTSASIPFDEDEEMFDEETEHDEATDDDEDDEYRYISQERESSNDINLLLVAVELDRAGVSDRAGARICNALFTALGIIDQNNRTAVIDRYKIRRARDQVHNIITAKNLETKQNPQCLYFDGKKDATKIQVRKDGKLHPETIKEDHYCICDPAGEFVGHITVPKSEDMPGVKVSNE